MTQLTSKDGLIVGVANKRSIAWAIAQAASSEGASLILTYAGERLGQGRENAKQFLKENPDIRQIVEERVRKELGLAREAEVAAV